MFLSIHRACCVIKESWLSRSAWLRLTAKLSRFKRSIFLFLFVSSSAFPSSLWLYPSSRTNANSYLSLAPRVWFHFVLLSLSSLLGALPIMSLPSSSRRRHQRRSLYEYRSSRAQATHQGDRLSAPHPSHPYLSTAGGHRLRSPQQRVIPSSLLGTFTSKPPQSYDLYPSVVPIVIQLNRISSSGFGLGLVELVFFLPSDIHHFL
jgi:hypothetical protein